MPFSTVASPVRFLITRSSSVARAAFLPPSSFSTSAKKPPIPTLSSSFTSAAGAIHYTLFIKPKQMASQMSSESFKFGPYKIDGRGVFYTTKLSYAMVNLRPLVPVSMDVKGKGAGFSFWIEKEKSFIRLDFWSKTVFCGTKMREVKRFGDLTADETSDLWITAQKVGNQLESYHKASSLTLAIQDGPQAGQSVPHVHIHILPRKVGDFEKNDEIYDALDEKEKELKRKLDLDQERKDRSLEEMAQEAEEYKQLF
ncbi:bifunctional triphosphatase/adenylylsulfatase FHIT-like [Pyrus ussuriensis x Pyrus communis]|uniref:Bifunctional triphosphatase/adenylylsulfatase FHIT-like n=1 Tax=Pyrus ussuriensis x Pyrus communis TaxID=2448454 RepID=A0A5N5I5N8_9ROSA|nr:bifunctional triphosphatase/adenylylsulfatase FHIT-like [Pyrus ussuriensis x Pyrus communis]